ncbi:hypothetical protein [Arabidopsis thaliana]|uniref:Uncharacterized protein F2K15.260 n=1 Tax=Arabidopsis thaliana TaxID=3702 RepID=Q9M399_ARATH|nr:hypothetical protein [Arabidopsis thaliana]
MASRFQEASLVTSPSYPNAVAWSSENLIAVAAGHLVIIINPALPTGPRGLITISDAELYQIGRVRSQDQISVGFCVFDHSEVSDNNVSDDVIVDLLTGGLLPSSLKRERSPCVRSLSWSEIGMSPNHGCLLAVCTAEGRVKLYRPPYSDFCAEWIEIVDISKMLYENLSSMNFGESKNPSTSLSKDQVVEHDHEEDERISSLKARKRRKTSANNINLHEKNYTDRASCSKQDSKAEHNVLEIEVYKQASNGQDRRSLPKALKKCSQEISPQTYVSREALLSSHSVAWSSLLRFSSESSCGNMLRFSLLAIGSKSGSVSIWKVHAPECYHIERSNVSPMVELTAIVQTHSSWVSTMSWGIFGCDSSNPQVVLVTGSCDGSVKIWMSNKEDLQNSVEVYKSSFFLLKEVVAVNPVQVSTLSFVVSNHYNAMHLAIGKGSGSFEVWKCEISTRKFEQIVSTNAHNQVLLRCITLCNMQDNYVRSWILCENAISEVPIPANTPGLSSTTDFILQTMKIFCSFLMIFYHALVWHCHLETLLLLWSDLPRNLVRCDFKLSLFRIRKLRLLIEILQVRNFNVELLNPMYQARSSNSTETALEEEKCPYCAAPVNFHSAEEAFCESSHQKKKKSKDKERCDESHKLERCCVSMQVCPPTPLWFCKCCNRMTLELAPETLFALPSFPSDLKSLPKSSFSKVASKPFCLFCGVLLQRKQPEFLLSASPV